MGASNRYRPASTRPVRSATPLIAIRSPYRPKFAITRHVETTAPALASGAMASTPSATLPRRKLFQHPGRVAIVAVILLAVLNLGIFLLNKSDTSPGGRNPLPVTVQSVTPEPGSIAGPIDTITVDLDDRLTGVLLVKRA